jgi:hypothetical protein
MNKETQQKLTELDRQIEELKAAGNRAGAAAMHSQKALLYTMAFDLQSAAREMAQAGALAEEEGRFDEMALAHLAQGKALAAQPGSRQKARDLLGKAAALYHTQDDKARQIEAEKELAALDAADQNMTGAIQRLDKALAGLNEDEDANLIIDLLLMRSNYHLAQQQVKTAQKDLTAALDLAERVGQKETSLTIRAQQQILDSFTAKDGPSEALETLREEAIETGQFDIAGDLQLQQANEALLAQNYEQAKQLAESVRRMAQESDDLGRFTRYLAASVTLANAFDKLENRRGVLYALLSCKAYLENHLGKAVGEQVNLLLDAYQDQWGEQAMAEAVRDYQGWIQAQQAKQTGNGK